MATLESDPTVAPTRAVQGCPSFSYDALPANHIRVLHVEESSTGTTECTLTTISLGQTGIYFALSYVWGTDPRNETILVNGQAFSVTANLLGALKAVRAFEDDIRIKVWIWIDAICINQNDKKDKEVQIPLMGSIYKSAESVLIWFPKIPNGSDLVFTVLRWLEARLWLESHPQYGNHANDTEKFTNILAQSISRLETCYRTSLEELLALKELMFFTSGLRQRGEGTSEVGQNVDGWMRNSPQRERLFPPRHVFWLSYLSFMTNSWFQRLWTFQEIRLAKHARLLHPSGSVDWKILQPCRILLSHLFFSEAFHPTFRRYEREQGLDMRDLIAELNPTGELESSAKPPFSLLALLTFTCQRVASVKKDHIFGLLGLVDTRTQAKLTVDYSRSDADVFSEAVKASLQEAGGAARLVLMWSFYRQTEPSVQDLPSWCPDFSNFTLRTQSFRDRWRITNDVYRKYARHFKIDLKKELRVLGVRGCRLDCIAKCSTNTTIPPIQWFWGEPQDGVRHVFDHSYLAERLEWLEDLLSTFPSCDNDTGVDLTSRLQNFLAESNQSDQTLDLQLLLRKCEMIHNYNAGTTTTAHKQELEDLNTLQKDFLTLILWTGYHYYFLTTSGKIGCSVKPLSPGDVVVFVPSGVELQILSANGTRYKTSACVEGYMNDSLLEVLDGRDDEWEMFYLR